MRQLFQGAWMNALFIHYELEPARLQPDVPFELDLRDEKAYVSLVAFTQERLRFSFGGQMTNWVGRWFANHEFLNVRTYVRHNGEYGIFFLAEWVPRRVATLPGPPLFGLPYQWGQIGYRHGARMLDGRVSDGVASFSYWAERSTVEHPTPCACGSLDEFLLERYVAFTAWHGLRRMFQVEHEPWLQTPIHVTVTRDSLLNRWFAWWPDSRLAGANYSPGVNGVTIGPPTRARRRRIPSVIFGPENRETSRRNPVLDRRARHSRVPA